MVPSRADPLATGAWFPLSRPSCFPFPCHPRQLSSHHPCPPFAGAAGGVVHGACRSPMTGWVSLSRRRQWCLALGREGGWAANPGRVRFRLKHHAPPFQNALAPSPSPSLFLSPPLFHAPAKKWEKKIQTAPRFQVVGRMLPACQLVCWGQCVRLFSTSDAGRRNLADGGRKKVPEQA